MGAESGGVWKSRFLMLFLALALVRGLLYATIVPPWQAPDEPQHYQMVRLVMDLKRIPTVGDSGSAEGLHQDVAQSLRENRFWELRHYKPAPDTQDANVGDLLRDERLEAATSHPPLYYIVVSLVIGPFRSSSLLSHLYVARALSVLMSLVTVWAVYTVSIWVSPGDQHLVWAACCLVVFLPMHSFMAGALNNDALAQMLSSLIVVLLARMCLRGLSIAQVGGLLLLLLLALLTKRTTLFLVPLVLTCPLASASPGLRRLRVSGLTSGESAAGRWYRRSALMVAVVIVLLLGFVLLYDSGAGRWWDVPGQLSRLVRQEPLSSEALVQYPAWVLLGFASFWANFGWMTVPMDVGWYAVLALLSLIAFAGMLRLAYRGWRVSSTWWGRRSVWAILVLAVLLVTVQALVSMLARQRPPQGRYLFPALVPITLCFTWGVFEWVPERYHRVTVGVWLIWWVCFDSIGVLGYVLPYFYG